ncbi:MAG: twin-arginine translocase TatA/TatE family subunit [Pseudomonadales bacterium]|nr:twin-arginine translocase TatA/TatE family subunit [Pseudomonadales bacterium]
MGFGGISIWQLVIILAIVLLLFGTKRLRNLGGDVGGAIKGFKKAMNDDDAKDTQEEKDEGLATSDAQKSAENDNEKS